MERERRDADEENSLWANPCDYRDYHSKPNYSPDQEKKAAENLVNQAKNTFTSTASYKEVFALKLHSFPSFDELLEFWKATEYLPKTVLPKEKVLNQDMNDNDIPSEADMDEVLPRLYKGLKKIVAGLHFFINEELNPEIISDASLKDNFNVTMNNVRAVLCYFNEIMNIRNLKIEKLPVSEIPNMKEDMGVSLYRDTLNYLEYLTQVFTKLYNLPK